MLAIVFFCCSGRALGLIKCLIFIKVKIIELKNIVIVQFCIHRIYSHINYSRALHLARLFPCVRSRELACYENPVDILWGTCPLRDMPVYFLLVFILVFVL